MQKKLTQALLFPILSIFLLCAVLSGCDSAEAANIGTGTSSDAAAKDPDAKRTTQTEFLSTSADGTVTESCDEAVIDTSHSDDGYIMILYNGDSDYCRIQITNPDGTLYSYPLLPGEYQTFPMTGGDGSYQIDVMEHAYDDMYALLVSDTIDVALSDEFLPFLYPNQYVAYTSESTAVSLGMELSDESADDLDYVTKVYNYLISNITYDHELAANIPSNYIPDNEETLETKTGICFDYASLACTLLRSQGIPTKLVVGYAGEEYHAWISVWLEEKGWVDNAIEFDGNSWSRLDPTFGASNSEDFIKKFVADDSNYTDKYYY